jgi:3-oxoacyl-[acyl-carrier protein] reductase
MHSDGQRVAVVTGGARGIGEAVAVRLSADGFRVFALDVAEPPAPRAGIADVVCDVTSAASVGEAFARVDREAGRLDALVNNAGIQRVGLVGEQPEADFSSVLAVHLHGAWLCASQAVPRMRAGGRGGAIVSVASVAAFVGLPGRGAYCAAKAGLLGLTRALALETADAGIRVNAVAPGFTRTAFVAQAVADGSLREDWMLSRVPAARLAEPQEIASAVAWLVESESRYMTGQTLTLDGGWLAQGLPQAPDWLRSAGPAR